MVFTFLSKQAITYKRKQQQRHGGNNNVTNNRRWTYKWKWSKTIRLVIVAIVILLHESAYIEVSTSAVVDKERFRDGGGHHNDTKTVGTNDVTDQAGASNSTTVDFNDEDVENAVTKMIRTSTSSSEETHLVAQSAKTRQPIPYEPALTEQYLMENLVKLGWDKVDDSVPGCQVWKEGDIAKDLQAFRNDLNTHFAPAEENFTAIPDLMESISKLPYAQKTAQEHSGIKDICGSLSLHPQGLQGLFPNSQLSKGNAGYMEPLLTPMRHPDFCFCEEYKRGMNKKQLYDLKYLIHDFEALCNKLKPTSKLVFVDIGADLAKDSSPVIRLLDLYKKFGFTFDYYYGFELEFTEPSIVFKEQIPAEFMSSFHWINTGVEVETDSKLNPFYSILQSFNEDDLIIVKLDMDTASMEVPLAHQLLDDERFHNLVDVFYFEHHVFMNEIARNGWEGYMAGSLKDTFELFHGLRKKGIAAHFWV